jgi:hypothetical protein
MPRSERDDARTDRLQLRQQGPRSERRQSRPALDTHQMEEAWAHGKGVPGKAAADSQTWDFRGSVG